MTISTAEDRDLAFAPTAGRAGATLALPGALLSHIATDGGPDGLSAAVDLARRAGADLLAVGAEAFQPTWFGGYSFAEATVMERLMESFQARLAATRDRFMRETGGMGERARWVSEQDYPARALLRHVAAADWIVAVRPGPGQGGTIAATPSELVMGAGLPVLFAPSPFTPLEARRIVVGWRDTREARRAIAMSLPLLVGAEQVTLVEIVTGSPDDDFMGPSRWRPSGCDGMAARSRRFAASIS